MQREGCRRLWRFRIRFDLTPILCTPLDLRFPATLDEGQFAMKKSKFTQEQIEFAPRRAAPRQARTGTWVEEVCRKLGISQASMPRRSLAAWG